MPLQTIICYQARRAQMGGSFSQAALTGAAFSNTLCLLQGTLCHPMLPRTFEVSALDPLRTPIISWKQRVISSRQSFMQRHETFGQGQEGETLATLNHMIRYMTVIPTPYLTIT